MIGSFGAISIAGRGGLGALALPALPRSRRGHGAGSHRAKTGKSGALMATPVGCRRSYRPHCTAAASPDRYETVTAISFRTRTAPIPPPAPRRAPARAAGPPRARQGLRRLARRQPNDGGEGGVRQLQRGDLLHRKPPGHRRATICTISTACSPTTCAPMISCDVRCTISLQKPSVCPSITARSRSPYGTMATTGRAPCAPAPPSGRRWRTRDR